MLFASIHTVIGFFLFQSPEISLPKAEFNPYAPNRIIVKFRTEQGQQANLSSIDPWLSRYNAFEIKPAFQARTRSANARRELEKLSSIYVIEIADTDPATAVAELANDPAVEYAQLDLVLTTQQEKGHTKLSPAPRIVERPPLQPSIPPTLPESWPNDPFFHSAGSWGQNYEDLWGLKKIRARDAWMQTNGQGQGVVVAVIDTGIDYNHPDIAANVWTNPGESPIPNGIDDDGNGFIDDWRGWDFTSCLVADIGSGICVIPDFPDNDPLDGHGHGTHVSGTIAAIGNNGIGIVGVAPRAKIMPLKGLNDQGAGYSSELAQAILYAAFNGADVLSCSWGCGSPCPRNPIIEDAVRVAHSMGAVVVFAAGNASADATLFSPQNMPETISVGASDPEDQRVDFSNYGIEVDLVAPGGASGLRCSQVVGIPGPAELEIQNILSLRASGIDMYAICGESWAGEMVLQEEYFRARGTSMACPHVAGAAAVIRSHRPDFSNDEIRQVLRISADDTDVTGFDENTGSGRLNLKRALEVQSVLHVKIQSPASASNWSSLDASIPVMGSASGADFAQYQLDYANVDDLNTWTALGEVSVNPVESGVLGYFDVSGLETGVYRIRLRVAQQDGLQYLDQVQIYLERNIQQITPSTEWEWAPAIWGERVVWVNAVNGNPLNTAVTMFDSNSQTTQSLTLGSSYAPAIWENRVVWQDKRHGNWEIYSKDLSTGQERRLTFNSADQTAPVIWGNYVAWTDFRNGNADIYLHNLVNGIQAQITADPAEQSGPAIYENKLVWTDYRHGDAEIYFYDFINHEQKRITNHPASQKGPKIWGNWIVWTDTRNPSGADTNWDIYLHDLITREEKRLTTEAALQDEPSIFGNRVVWIDRRDGNEDVYLYDLLSEETRALSAHPASQTSPKIWGNRIVWTDYRNGNFDVFLKIDESVTPLVANLASPQANSLLNPEHNWVPVFGTVAGDSLSNWQVYYRRGEEPWSPFSLVETTPVLNQLLANWEIFDLPTGNYELKLVLNSQDGLQTQSIQQVQLQRIDFEILSPLNDALLRAPDQSVSIQGIATGGDFASYQLFYTRDFGPAQWVPISAVSSSPVVNASLAQWNIGSLDNGPYRLKLQIQTTQGAVFEKERPVFVENIRAALVDPLFQTDPVLDGERIVYSQLGTDTWNVYYLNLVDGISHRLTNADESSYFDPDISGNRVVYKQFNSRTEWGDVYLVDLETEMSIPLAFDPQQESSPVISGDYVVFRGIYDESPELTLYHIPTRVAQKITADPGDLFAPAIDGNRVVWEDLRNGNRDIYLYEISSGQEIPLVVDPFLQQRPDISGDYVVWQDKRNGNWDIYWMNLVTGEERQITSSTADQTNPKINGHRIIWTDNRHYNPDVYLYDLELNLEIPITRDSAEQYATSISGNRIVWDDRRAGISNGDIYYVDLP